MERVPVIHKDGTPLMPCKPAKARKLLRDGKATKHWTKEGTLYIQLTWDSTKHLQDMCLGIDPGAKFDGYAVLTDYGTPHYLDTNWRVLRWKTAPDGFTAET